MLKAAAKRDQKRRKREICELWLCFLLPLMDPHSCTQLSFGCWPYYIRPKTGDSFCRHLPSRDAHTLLTFSSTPYYRQLDWGHKVVKKCIPPLTLYWADICHKKLEIYEDGIVPKCQDLFPPRWPLFTASWAPNESFLPNGQEPINWIVLICV